MSDAIPPAAIRATAEYSADPAPTLLCSNCNHTVTDDDPECPTCESPIDWTASDDALHAWKEALDGRS